jgi:hypothetical protein
MNASAEVLRCAQNDDPIAEVRACEQALGFEQFNVGCAPAMTFLTRREFSNSTKSLKSLLRGMIQ